LLYVNIILILFICLYYILDYIISYYILSYLMENFLTQSLKDYLTYSIEEKFEFIRKYSKVVIYNNEIQVINTYYDLINYYK